MTAGSAPHSGSDRFDTVDDVVLPFDVKALDVRGRVVRLGPAVDAMLARHDYPAPVSRLVAEATALTALLGTSLKFDGRFILQTQSDGPVSLMVVDFETPDRLRAYARFDAQAVAEAERAGRATPGELLGVGHLAMTVDQGPNMSRYQGVVPLEGGGLEGAAHQYFRQSEQIPTRVRLAVAEVMRPGNGRGPRHAWRAGGMLVQFLPASQARVPHQDLPPGDVPQGHAAPEPAAEDEAWNEARAFVDTVEDYELTDPGLAPERLLLRLFHDRGVTVYERRTLRDKCRCSRSRILGILKQFREDEVAEMTREGAIIVTCEFCNSEYRYDPAELKSEAGPAEGTH